MVTASREFQIFVKPVGAACNLDCSYCYYLEKQKLYPRDESPRMPESVLEDYIAQHIAACPIPTVLFSWHGGEATLLGVDYFRRIVEFQRGHAIAGRDIINDLQTNGTLLDEEWCRFLAAEHFTVGLSLDGPGALHDRYRLSKAGKPTHAQAMHGLQLLQRFGIPHTVLCVVHAGNVDHPLMVYRFFKEAGVRNLVFLPLVMRADNGSVTPETVPARAFGDFLCAIFDEWIRQDIGRVNVLMFEEAARPEQGIEHALCVFRPTCGELPVLEHNGDFYSCDHFVDRAHFIGNIREKSLVSVLEDPGQRSFGLAKRDTLPKSCRQCTVLEYCNGGCPKDRFVATPGEEFPTNYLCSGYKTFFTHARPAMRRLAAHVKSGQTIENFAQCARSSNAKSSGVSRNELCPCGSGKKFKRCCGAKHRASLS